MEMYNTHKEQALVSFPSLSGYPNLAAKPSQGQRETGKQYKPLDLTFTTGRISRGSAVEKREGNYQKYYLECDVWCPCFHTRLDFLP